MSLFPAYSLEKNVDEQVNTGASSNRVSTCGDLSWLNNPSYPSASSEQNQSQQDRKSVVVEEPEQNHSHEVIRSPARTNHKKKKKKHKKERSSSRKGERVHHQEVNPSSKITDDDDFYEDKKQERTNFLVETLHRPAIPRYNKHNQYFRRLIFLRKKFKKRKINRYFSVPVNAKEKTKEENFSDSNSKEEELTKMTEYFNKKLGENAKDVDVWLEYVNFQDTMYEFEKQYRKNPVGGERVTVERKLAILERALKSNPTCERLLAMRLHLSERVRPADELADECSRALTQDPGNLTLWRALLRTSRNNTSRCTVPGVLQLFSKAITRVGQLRLHRPPVLVEQDLLVLLLECGVFLQQAGLWEQLWTLLQMYLSLSLTASGQFSVPSQQHDDRLQEEEDEILKSGLPLSVLWLRVEKLRAGRHFLPENSCDTDPQRVVFSDDVAGLLQPVMSAELRLPLVVLTLVLLKLPLLPTRHSLLKLLGLLSTPSAVSNAETLLAAAHVTGILDSPVRYLCSAVDLVVEPQCVRDQAGSQQFLSWVLSVAQRCAELLPTAEAVLIHAWLLRFHALLCRLNTLGMATVDPRVAKQARTHAKQLLKQPQFQDNLLLYTEYALVERSAGELGKAVKVLETASAMPHKQGDVHYLLLCRRLVECHLARADVMDKKGAVRVLSSLQLSAEAIMAEHSEMAGHSLTVAAAMTPQPLVESLACFALLLYLNEGLWPATAMLQRHIDLLPHSPGTLGALWVEQLYEVLVDLLNCHSAQSNTGYTLLRSSLTQALKLFPDNLSLLNTLASVEVRGGGGGTPLWRLVSLFPASSALSRLLLVFVAHSRISSLCPEEQVGCRHYLRNLLRQLTEEQTTGECPLMWRLYLQLVAALDSPKEVKQVFYRSLQHLPWVKALYLDAVKFLPEELSEVQDLLIEKELRLHTTPEELDILRD